MQDYLTTRELAELLRIKERKVYDLASSDAVPYIRATGKLLFSRAAIEAWLASQACGPDFPPTEALPAVFLGSHDPLLEWAIRQSRCGLACSFDSSVDGLEKFSQAAGIATGLHLYQPDAGPEAGQVSAAGIRGNIDDAQWNLPEIHERFGNSPVVLIHWARRLRGLLQAPDQAQQAVSLSTLGNLRIVPRQEQAGAQLLLRHLLKAVGVRAESLQWTEPAHSESDAALAVQEGRADVAFGLKQYARQYNLGFTRIIDERFDLLVDRRAYFDAPMQALLSFSRSSEFQDRCRQSNAYDCRELGRVLFNGAG